MSTPLIWKVYNAENEALASLRYAEDAAALCALWSGSKVKVDGVIVWHEGKESQSAAESYDHACGVMHQRRREAQDRRLANLTRFHRS